MKGQLANDRGISTIQHSAFNYDKQERSSIDILEARDIMNYEVEVHPCYTADGREIAGLNYLQKSTDGSIIPSAGIGDKFTPYNTVEFFDSFVNDIMPQVPDLKLETVATLYGSGAALITADLGKDFFLPGDESAYKSRVVFYNPNNGSATLQLGFSSVRIICMNTLAAARNEMANDDSAFNIKHTESIKDRVGYAVQTIFDRIRDIQTMKDRMTALAGKNVDATTVQRVINKLYPLEAFPTDRDIVSPGRTRMENVRAEVIRQFESGETAQTFTKDSALKLFQANTFRIFNPIKENKRTDRADIATRGIFGTVADRVNKILNVVEQESGIRIAA